MLAIAVAVVLAIAVAVVLAIAVAVVLTIAVALAIAAHRCFHQARPIALISLASRMAYRVLRFTPGVHCPHQGHIRLPQRFPWIRPRSAFGRPAQTWMVNFRVRDLDAMVRQLRGAGIEVEIDPEEYPNGRFARLADPEGNPIQLWEPGGNEAQAPAR